MARRLFTVALAAVTLASLACSSYGAGALGHFVIARRAIDGIMDGSSGAPDALKEILKDPDCQKAFCGGAVAPDICPEDSHYGATGDLAKKMGAKAVKNLEAALKSNDAAKVKKARIEVAFCYGWLSHVATDVNLHPIVNGHAGDAYTYCSTAGKGVHAAQEVQFDAYVYWNYKKPGEKYAVTVPFEFLSGFVHESTGDLKRNLKSLTWKVMGEIAAKELVSRDSAKLKNKWEMSASNSIKDTVTFVADPDLIQNWDLDAGPISTEDFKKLREAVKKANGGKLPKNWGGSYLDYYHQALGDSAPTKPAKPKTPELDFKLPAPPKVHAELTDVDRLQIGQWRDKCVASLNKQMEEDPLRAANREECSKIGGKARELTCGKCGFKGSHYWIENSWSCPSCEFRTTPQDVKRADGKTYRQFAQERMQLYKDKIAEIEKQAQKMLAK